MPPSKQFIREPERSIPVRGAYEVVVLGGGPAGIAAAAAAAACGRRTILIERYGFLGGMGTAAGVTNFCGTFANVYGDILPVVHGVADDLIGRNDRLGGLREPHVMFGRTMAQAYDTAAYKCAADDLMSSRNVGILFHALAAGASMKSDHEIEALFIESKSGREAVCGEIFIDCSGDGDLAVWAGAPYEIGDGAGGMLYPTMMFRVNGVDPQAAGEAWRIIPQRMEEAAKRGVHFPRKGAIVRPQKNPIEWRVNVSQLHDAEGRALDGADVADLTAGELEGRRQAREEHPVLRDDIPGFSDSYIVDIPPQLGIRETRRLKGAYQLSGEDVLSCADFPDTIGVNGWPIESHIAGDVKFIWPEAGSRGFNHLPYRMLLAPGVSNLLVAGRCASMTHEGQSAARVSGACFVMGQAAGTAAHLALASGRPPAEISVAALQTMLERDGAYLGNEADNEMPAQRARS
jgi:hypothetical protein